MQLKDISQLLERKARRPSNIEGSVVLSKAEFLMVMQTIVESDIELANTKLQRDLAIARVERLEREAGV